MSLPPYDPAATQQPRPGQQVSLRSFMPRPQVTYAILAVTILVYLLQMLSAQDFMSDLLQPLLLMVFSPSVENALRERGLYEGLMVLIRGAVSDLIVLMGGKINPLIMIGQVWRLFTPALLHASIPHILFNMYALYAFGTFLEPVYGRLRFLMLYVLAAFGGNVLSFLLTQNVSVGASPAVFGLVGAQGVFVFQNRELFGDRARGMISNILMIVVINLFLGLSPGIDNWGHLGGLLAGLAFAWFAGPRLVVAGFGQDFYLDDERSTQAVWTAALLLFLAVSALAYWGMTAR
jgi:rhomboid protease GluP